MTRKNYRINAEHGIKVSTINQIYDLKLFSNGSGDTERRGAKESGYKCMRGKF